MATTWRELAEKKFAAAEQKSPLQTAVSWIPVADRSCRHELGLGIRNPSWMETL